MWTMCATGGHTTRHLISRSVHGDATAAPDEGRMQSCYSTRMISADEVKKLADLGRVALSDEEVEKLRGEINSILAYVDVIQKVTLPEHPAASVHLALENVMREDGEPHETGAFTEALLAQAPRRDGNYLKVKKILP